MQLKVNIGLYWKTPKDSTAVLHRDITSAKFQLFGPIPLLKQIFMYFATLKGWFLFIEQKYISSTLSII